jgi:serralysin
MGGQVVASLDSNLFFGNTASTYGGGVTVDGAGIVPCQNDIIVSNTSLWEGVYVNAGTLLASHWTLADNGNYGLTINGGTAILTNTIVASHTLAGFWGTDITADHTLFHNNATPCSGGASCTNNLTGNPQFVNPAAGDYHLGPGSAAIDAGIYAGVSRDIDHEPRIGIPDLGADEYWPPGAVWYDQHLPLLMRNAPE